jgi:uncharacterized protein YjbI with pentapeptide repeats
VSFVISALGLVDLDGGTDFMSEQALWPMAVEEMPPGAILDLAMPKPRGEILIAGKARAPDGRPVEAMPVDVQVGGFAKRVVAFGDRFWRPTSQGIVFEAPKPFVEMPLVLERAFGGPGHPTNPNGLGYGAGRLLASGQPVPLPNIEDARRLIRNVDDSPIPVRLGPIDPASPERLRYAGTYDRTWLQKDHPGLPADVDPRLFLVAPEDQQIDGYFQGNEPFRIAGFSSSKQELIGRLPGLRVRAFVERTSPPAGIYEVDMKIDTVWVFGSAEKAVLIYRGAIVLADIDAKDAATVMLAYEHADAEPRPQAHYLEQIRLRNDKDQAIKYVLADQYLRPPRDPAEEDRRRQARIAYNRKMAERFREAQQLNYRLLADKHGLPPVPMPAMEMPDLPVLVPTPEEIESGELDLAEFIDSAFRFLDEQRAFAEAKRSEYAPALEHAQALARGQGAAALDGLIASLPPEARGTLEALKARFEEPVAHTPEGAPIASIADLLDGVAATPDDETRYREAAGRFLNAPEASPFASARDAVAQLDYEAPPIAAQARPGEQSFSDMIAALTAGPDGRPLPEAVSGGTEAAVKAAEDRLRAGFPDLPVPEGVSPIQALLDRIGAPPAAAAQSADELRGSLGDRLDEAQVQYARGMVQARLMTPEALFPMEPMSPRVARRLGDLVQAERAAGRSLAGRDFAGADLSGEDLAGLDLSGALLEKANLSRTRLDGVSFSAASLAGANLFGAMARNIDFSGANLSQAVLRNADLSGARLQDVAVFNAQFDGADLDGAHLSRLRLMTCSARGTRFTRTTIRQTIFMQSPVDGAVFDGADLEECILLKCGGTGMSGVGVRMFRCLVILADAAGANFTGAILDTSSFVGPSQLADSMFDGARGFRTTFHGATLSRARFEAARMDEAVFSEGTLDDACFRLASLKGALFGAADLRGVDGFGCNLRGAQLRRADLSGASLRGANLYLCDLSDATLACCDLSGANLDKTHFRMPTDAT